MSIHPINGSPATINPPATDTMTSIARSHFSLGNDGNASTKPTASAPAAPERPLLEMFKATAQSIEAQRAAIDQAIAGGRGGAPMESGDLLDLQARVYRYSQEMELISRVVDKTVSATKTILQTQV